MVKKTLGLVFIFVFLAMPAFAEDPISQEILDQARAQAGLFMDLKNALGLDWLDEYNAYLDNPTSSPEPSWASSVAELVGKSYLSDAFPDDFSITPSGQEVTISRTITNQGIKDALPIYLPSVAISGDDVSLLVQRPAQWVSWEAALASKVSRAGDDDPDILPGASLEFGAGSEIEFVNNDGKLVGIDSLTYKGEELEDRFVNAAGDNMTGPLTIEGNKVWHAGNDGSGSGLDADELDGKDGSYYLAAGNLTGIIPAGRLSGTYGINISGRASVASNADYAANADKLDGKDAGDFALSGHTHNYVSKEGDTITGNLIVSDGNLTVSGSGKYIVSPEYRINDSSTRIYEGGNDAVRIKTPSGYVDIGPANTGWAHFVTDRPAFYFNKPVNAVNQLKVYGTSTYLTGSTGYIGGKRILTTDDISSLGGEKKRPLRVREYTSPRTYTWSPGSGTTYIEIEVKGGDASSGVGGTSRFGSYVYAYGGNYILRRGGSYSGGWVAELGKAASRVGGSYSQSYTFRTGGDYVTRYRTIYTGGYAWRGFKKSELPGSVTVVVGARSGSYGSNGYVKIYEYKFE